MMHKYDSGCTGVMISLMMLAAIVAVVTGLWQSAAIAGDAAGAQEYRVIEQKQDRLFVRLPNGLLVIVQELRTAPVVSAQVWVKTGSIYEQQHVGAGLSHFLEHLLSGGSTTTRTEAQSNEILGRIGAQTNAATGLETVHYYINTTSQHTAQAVDLLSDWMQNSTIRQEEYEREREVIQREFEHGQGSPERIFWKLTQQALYQVHPARHPTIGYLNEFLAVTRDEIHDFYRRMYVPNNMVFVVVGDVNKQEVVDQIARLWKASQSRPLPAVALPAEPVIDEPRTLSGYAVINQPRLRLAWPGTKLGQEHDYALDLLANVLGGGESSRLQQTVRDRDRLVNSIGAYNLSFAWGQGFFGVDSTLTVPAGSDAEDASEKQIRLDKAIVMAKEAILAQVRRIAKDGVSEQELARAKRQQLASAIYRSQTAQAAASRMARDLIGMGDPDYQERYVIALEALAAADLKAAAEAMLKEERLIAVTLLPQEKGQAVEELTRPVDPQVEVVSRPVDLDNTAVLSQYRIVHRAAAQQDKPAVEVGPVQRHVLPNGMRVIIQRSTLVPAVSMQMYQLGGLLGETPGQEGVANAVATMMTRGTKTRAAQEIASQIEDLGAAIEPGCGNNTFYTQALALRDDWQAVLELMADVVLNPTFPQREWDVMQPRLLAAIDRQEDSWGGELRARFRSAYFGQDYPWSQTLLGRREVVASLTGEQLAQFYFDRLNAGQTVMAIVGDIDPEEALAKVTALFGGVGAQARVPFALPQQEAPRPGVYTYMTKKPMVGVQFGFGPGPDRKSEDFAGVAVLSRVLSNFPTGWLEQELRGKGPGLVYAVGAGQFTGVAPGYLAALFNTQPATAIQAVERTSQVFGRVKREEIDQATLDRAKAAVLTSEFMSKQTNSDRATEAALNELYGLGLDAPQKLLAQINSLTGQDLQRIARTYLRQPVLVIITSSPLDAQELLKAAAAGDEGEATRDEDKVELKMMTPAAQ